RHHVVDGDWPPTEDLVADEEGLAACWAWEQFYLGMAVAGTVYNELRSQATRQRRWPRLRRRPVIRQHEPSGGGRSIPQHRRLSAQTTEPRNAKAFRQVTGPNVRRTWLRRDPAAVQQAGRRLAADLAEMIRENRYQPRPAEPPEEGRLGGRAWGQGRGA